MTSLIIISTVIWLILNRFWLFDMNLLYSFRFELLILPIQQLFTHTNERSVLWQNLVFHRIIYGLLFEIRHFHIIHLIFHCDSLLRRILQTSQHFQMCHFIYENIITVFCFILHLLFFVSYHIHLDICFVG